MSANVTTIAMNSIMPAQAANPMVRERQLDRSAEAAGRQLIQ